MKINIDIIVEGRLYASRTWGQVPRIGEAIILPDYETENGKLWCQITNVIWSDDERASALPDQQWVQLLCKTVKRT